TYLASTVQTKTCHPWWFVGQQFRYLPVRLLPPHSGFDRLKGNIRNRKFDESACEGAPLCTLSRKKWPRAVKEQLQQSLRQRTRPLFPWIDIVTPSAFR